MSHNTNQKEKVAVHSTIRMLIPMTKQSEALEILGPVCEQIKFEPNCIFSRLYRGVDDVRAIARLETHQAGGMPAFGKFPA